MARFEIYRSGIKDEFRFRLKANNGQIILSSEGYTNKASCLKGIESVKKNSTDTKRYNIIKAPSNMFRFTLTAANNQIIGVSQNYISEAGCENGIESVKRNAVLSEIKELTN